jgi:ABC-2 type transport system ATP-binding protein
MIRANRLVVVERGTRILQDVTLDVGAGECVALGGAPRSGKSTLLRVLSGWAEPQSGSIHLRREQRAADARRLRRAVAYAAPDTLAGDGLRVDEYLRFISYVRSARDARVPVTPELVRRVGLDPAAPVAALTRPARAALAVGAALIASADVVLIDSAIDDIAPDCRDGLIMWLDEARHRGAAVVLTTNERALHESICGRLWTLENGQLTDTRTAMAVRVLVPASASTQPC